MSKAAGFTHDNVNNKTVDWYTPAGLFEKLGLTFDLDPATCPGGVPWIPAKTCYALPDDGLTLPWNGRVWLNPPYGVHTSRWLNKAHIHRNGIALVFARTDCAWFHDYALKADALLFIKKRIKFVDGKGATGGNGAGAGSMMIAWGEDCANALAGMADYGWLVNLSCIGEEQAGIDPRWVEGR